MSPNPLNRNSILVSMNRSNNSFPRTLSQRVLKHSMTGTLKKQYVAEAAIIRTFEIMDMGLFFPFLF